MKEGIQSELATKQLQQSIDSFLLQNNYVTAWIENADISSLIASNSSVVSVKKGNLLFHQGSVNHCIYVVRTGRMRIATVGENGAEYCIYIAEKGCMIGEVSTVDHLPNHVSAYAITDSTLYQLNANDMTRLIHLHPDLSIEIMETLAYKIRLMSSQFEYSQRSAEARVAGALLALSVRHGVKPEAGPGLLIQIRFTHEEMASLTRLNRVTVSRIMRVLAKSGAIETGSYCLVR